MPYYVVHALDAPGMSEARAAARPAHRARLRRHHHDLKVHVGGPLLNDGGEMCGTMLVIEADSAAVVFDYLSGDPYSEAGVYETVQLHEFKWGLGQPEESNG